MSALFFGILCFSTPYDKNQFFVAVFLRKQAFKSFTCNQNHLIFLLNAESPGR